MTKAAERLGREILARRSERGLSQQELADRMGDRGGVGIIRRLEQFALNTDRPEPGRPRASTLGALDRALRWTAGSAAAVWDEGAEPVPLDSDHGDRVIVYTEDAETRALLVELVDQHLSDEEKKTAMRVALAAIRALRDS